MKATIYMPIVLIALSSLVMYFLATEILGKEYGWIGPLLPLSFWFLEAHPHTLMATVWVPLFYHTLIRFEKNPSLKNAVPIALSWGLAGLTHVLGTFGIASIILMYFTLKRRMRHLVLILGIGTTIQMLFWFPLIFIYKAQTPNPYQKLVMGYYDILMFTQDFFQIVFKNILAPLILLGTYTSLKEELRNVIVSSFLGLYLLGVLFIAIGGPLIAYKIHLYKFGFGSLLVLAGLKRIISTRPRIIPSIAIMLLALNAMTIMDYSSSTWVINGYSDFKFKNLQSWILSNTKPDDVFLSSYESSFMIFSISGRKTVLFRRTHASPFVDYDNRSAEIIVALKGRNISESLRILRKYHVKYIYIDDVSRRDPLWVPIKYRRFLEKRGVKCKVELVRYDPADPKSIRIQACVVDFSISNELRRYLIQVFRDNEKVIYKVVYPE
ncbi:hypothetical protein PNA2_0875 [Pyrococcus sp. NA2]|nr:hypothetical protein PNA2_0875 [Pyrococcus sp. NA2]